MLQPHLAPPATIHLPGVSVPLVKTGLQQPGSRREGGPSYWGAVPSTPSQRPGPGSRHALINVNTPSTSVLLWTLTGMVAHPPLTPADTTGASRSSLCSHPAEAAFMTSRAGTDLSGPPGANHCPHWPFLLQDLSPSPRCWHPVLMALLGRCPHTLPATLSPPQWLQN